MIPQPQTTMWNMLKMLSLIWLWQIRNISSLKFFEYLKFNFYLNGKLQKINLKFEPAPAVSDHIFPEDGS